MLECEGTLIPNDSRDRMVCSECKAYIDIVDLERMGDCLATRVSWFDTCRSVRWATTLLHGLENAYVVPSKVVWEPPRRDKKCAHCGKPCDHDATKCWWCEVKFPK